MSRADGEDPRLEDSQQRELDQKTQDEWAVMQSGSPEAAE
jgi:hypothetical protein